MEEGIQEKHLRDFTDAAHEGSADMYIYIYTHVPKYIHMYSFFINICIHICRFVFIHTCMYLCVIVCMYVCMYVCLFKCLGPVHLGSSFYFARSFHGPPAMPRSDPDSSEPSSSSSSSSNSEHSSQVSENTRRERDSARARATEAKRERRFENLRAWFARRLVVLLCELSLERQYQDEGRTVRQVAGQLSSFRRRIQGQPAPAVVAFARPQLYEPLAQGLQNDVDCILELLGSEIPPNDYAWMLSDQVGKIGDPSNHQLQQFLRLQLSRSLARHLHSPDPNRFTQQALVYACFGFHVERIWLAWHLLPDEERYAFQCWYAGYTDGRDDVPAMEQEDAMLDTDENAPEPARGSRDPPPR